MRRLSKRLPMSTDLEDEIFSRDETMRPALQQVPQEIEAEPQRSASRLDAIEAQISTIDDEPIDAEVIEEQAEELEERIEEQSPEVNDTATTNSEPENITENITAEDETHPGTALADKIIAEIKEQNAVMDVSRVLNRHELDIASMPEPIAEAINNAADTQRAAIRAEQAKAKEGAE
jgi:hypothetical protein